MTRDFARSEQHLRHADESASRGVLAIGALPLIAR